MKFIPNRSMYVYIKVMENSININLKYLYDFKTNIDKLDIYVKTCWFNCNTGANAVKEIRDKICSKNYVRIQL